MNNNKKQEAKFYVHTMLIDLGHPLNKDLVQHQEITPLQQVQKTRLENQSKYSLSNAKEVLQRRLNSLNKQGQLEQSRLENTRRAILSIQKDLEELENNK
jgi:hypothetical protein